MATRRTIDTDRRKLSIVLNCMSVPFVSLALSCLNLELAIAWQTYIISPNYRPIYS